ncbi:PKD domain-containing protein [Enterovibrio norvegicus]|uniref:PKD domain-containing protein n=1 Tax=Enterovibrio norvegicus TaxID=188144 RepID=UPI00352F130E
MKLHKLASLVSVLVATTIIGGCGGGGGSDSETSSPPDPSSPETPVESSASLTGVFIDSPVEGLLYTTSSGESGSTNAQGEFSYNAADMISFTLAGIQFPEIEASGVLTPFDLVGNFNTRNPTTSNLLRLLQSLDDDGDISQTISLDTDKINSIQQANLSYEDLMLSTQEFEALLASHSLFGLPEESALISANQAFEHFEKTLSESKVIDTDNDGIPNATDPDDDNDGVEDSRDHFAWDKDESLDFDLDFIGDNSDTDDDNDGVPDTEDTEANFAFTATSLESGFTFTVFDSSTGRLFATDFERQQLKTFSLSSAEEISVVEFEEKPSYLFFEPTSKRIYVSLRDLENPSLGSIAVVDSNTLEIINVFDVDIRPGEIAARADGLVVVNSRSSSRTNLYNAESGELVDSQSSAFGGTIAISKDGNWLYIGDSGGLETTLDKYALSEAGITPSGNYVAYDKPVISDEIWLSPDGSFVITKAGDILDTENLSVLGSLPDVAFINNIHFDEERDFLYITKFSGSIFVVNAKSLSVVPDREIEGRYDKTFTVDDLIYLVDIDYFNEQLTINKFTHPCLDCGDNQKPVAQFTYTPEDGTTLDEYTFDASDSFDPDADQTLLYRWDIGGDGKWETEYSISPELKHSFLTATTEPIVLQVIDNLGLTDTKNIIVEVESGVDIGVEITNSTANQLDFSPTHVIADPQRNRAYLSDKEGKRLYVINPITGISARYFEFDYMPERMALSPDGSQLYVTLLTQEHNHYWYEEDQTGFIATFDLEQLARVNLFEVPVDPFDIVATSYDRLVVSTGSGQYGSVFLLDASSGETIGNSNITERSYLTLSKDENYVFASNEVNTVSRIQTFSIDRDEIEISGTFGYPGNYPESAKTWISPDGMYLITSKGSVHNISDTEHFTELGVEAKHISFDVENNKFSLVSPEGTVNYFDLSTFRPTGVLDGANAQFATYFQDQLLVIEQSVDNSTTFGVTTHPCLICAFNTAPVANFSYTPTAGTVEDTFVFDASLSSDVEDQESLLYRWDVGSDGTWETDFTNQNTFNHVFTSVGNFSVTLEVMDPSELSSTRTIDLVVRDLPDYGVLVEDSQIFQIDSNKTVFEVDATRNKAYFSDAEEKRLYVVDLRTGFTERYFEFDQMPERMALSPDGTTLYLALLTEQQSSDWLDTEQNGFIAIFDLETMAKVHAYEVPTDPFDLAVNQQGKLIVTSGSGSLWAKIYALDSLSGKILGSELTRERSQLSLHPSGDLVFAADTDSGLYDFEKFDISDEGITSLGYPPYSTQLGSHHYDIGGKVWVSPDGNHLISRSSDIFNTDDMTFVTKLNLQIESISDIAFDPDNSVFLVSYNDNNLAYFSDDDFKLVSELPSLNGEYISFIKDGFVSISIEENNIYFGEHPCIPCKVNTPPNAIFTHSPSAVTTVDTLLLDASSSIDKEDNTSLQYRWDIESDGIWESDFSDDASYTHTFPWEGEKSVSLQAKDSNGVIHTYQKTIDVGLGYDHGIDSGKVFSDFFFMQNDIQINTAKQTAYIADKKNNRIYFLDLKNGTVEKYFDLDSEPKSLTISNDGSTLYAAINDSRENSTTGYIAEFDLNLSARLRTYPIPFIPYDLVVNQNGKLIVSAEDGSTEDYRWTINILDTETGEVLHSYFEASNVKLAIPPSGDFILARGSNFTGKGIVKFILENDHPVHGHYLNEIENFNFTYEGYFSRQTNWWLSPNGEFVVTSTGVIFDSLSMQKITILEGISAAILDVGYDIENDLMFVIGVDGSSKYFTLNDFNYIDDFDASNVQYLNYFDGKLLALESDQDAEILRFIEHPCSYCANNSPPIASFTYSPGVVTTLDNVILDASSSYDQEDMASLYYRWDLNNDGTWDTAFSKNPTYTHNFVSQGAIEIALEVYDAGRSVDKSIQTVDIETGYDHGIKPMDSNTPYVFNFSVTDIAVDSFRNFAYISDETDKRLYVINLSNGLIEKYFEFDSTPENISISRDGAELYLGLYNETRNSDLNPSNKNGHISVFSLEKKALIKTFETSFDPYDIVSTELGTLIVSAGKKWADQDAIFVLDSNSGVVLSGDKLFDKHNLHIDDDNKFIYAIGFRNIEKFEFTKESINSVGNLRYDVYEDGYRNINGEFWLSPLGGHLISFVGDIYTSTDMTYVKSISLNSSERIVSLIKKPDDTSAFILTTSLNDYGNEYPYKIHKLNSKSLEIDHSQSAQLVNRLVHAGDSELIGIVENDDGTTTLVTLLF